MTEPIVFISHLRIKEGALDTYRQMQREAARALEADKPRTLAFLPYLDAGGTRLTIFHLFADAESMDLHFEGAQDRAAKAYEVLVPEGWEIYGTRSGRGLDTMRKAAAASGVSLTLQPEYVGGFLRATSG
jgi:hypothetical protein